MKTMFIRLLSLCPGLVLALMTSSAQAANKSLDEFWNQTIRPAYFGDRSIQDSDDIIALEAPKRAADPAIVPISIKAGFPQTEQRYIKTITLIIDKNPVPFAARFTFTPKSGRADLALRIRVNQYSPVRAIAETNDGSLYMSSRFVKASGGCSAPPGADLQTALARIGNMKLKTPEEAIQNQPLLTQLMVSHPNITGMQMDQVTRLFMPPHFVKEIKVTFDGEPVLVAETDIAISENPSFRFYFVPERDGELVAEIVDSKGQRFTENFVIAPAAAMVTSN